MNGSSPFTLQASDLCNLGADRAVEFFRRLLWAEASRIGIGRHLIDVPDCINVGDGGIDAYIENVNPSTDDLIPQGTSGFQIKASDLGPIPCRRELHQKKDLNEPLKPEVKKILDEGGNYVLVLFADITSQQRRIRKEAIRSELSKLGYENPVRVYTAAQLVGFAERFVSLVTWFRRDLSQCLSFASWAERGDVKTPRLFVPDEKRQQWIDGVRQALRNPSDNALVYRVIGLSGIGKTRLVFESLWPDDLNNRVVYVTADKFLTSPLYFTLQNDQNLSAIVVVDECDLNQHNEIVRSFSGRGSRLTVFTISHDIGAVPQPARHYILTPLASDKIEKILRAEIPGLPVSVVRRLSEFADGYPRIADLLAQSYHSTASSTDEFSIIRDDDLMYRLIGGRMDIDSEPFRRTRRVLQGMSLLQKVGYEGNLSVEAQWLAQTIDIKWTDFKDVVWNQQRRGIVQGQYYIYVTPFMLRVHLLREWWESQGPTTQDDFLAFISSMPEALRQDLVQRFLEHIPFVVTTERGREFVSTVLSSDGIFADGELIQTEVGADFFSQLAQADPESALHCLNRTLRTWSKEKLLQFTIGRRQIVSALGNIAVWKNLFSDAARLLLKLGEAENETWSNNASGVFAALFSPGRGELAPTEASLLERFPILEDALNSQSSERRQLGLRACDQALESQHFVRLVGGEYYGFQREPQRWIPETYGELFNAYRQVWQLLQSRLDSLPESEQNEALEILLRRARGLVLIQSLSDMIIDALSDLANKPYADDKQVITTVAQIHYYDGKRLPLGTRQRLELLRDRLTGNDFSSLLKRYVGMHLLEDEFDEEGNRVDQVQPRLEQLAQQAVTNRNLLQPELDWLVTTQAERGHQFGYTLGKRDEGFLLWPDLLEAQRNIRENGSSAFAGGYLRALYEFAEQRWEQLLDGLAADPGMNHWVPELTWRSGMTDQAAMRILDLAEDGVIDVGHFRTFSYGSAIANLSEDVFRRWLDFLIHSSHPSACLIALSLYHRYYLFAPESERTLPEELTLELLAHPSLFQLVELDSRQKIDEYEWAEIGKAFVQHYSARALVLAEQILKHFGEEGTITGGFYSQTQAVINEITRKYPSEVWSLVTQYLGPPIDSRAYHIKEWLRGDEHFEEKDGMLSFIPVEKIWEWVDENVERSAWYLATFVPKTLDRGVDNISLAREILVRYGEREDVRNNLIANFSTEGWWGSATLHYTKKKQQLLDYREKEDNENVIRWLDEYIAHLDRDIERSQIREERQGY